MNEVRNKNSVEISGNIGKEPEVRQHNGYEFVNFSIAHSEKVYGKDDEYKTHWYNIVCRGEAKKDILTRIREGQSLKGHFVEVTGKLSQRTFTDRSGIERTAFEVIAFGIIFYPKRIKTEVENSGTHATWPSASKEAFRDTFSTNQKAFEFENSLNEEDVPTFDDVPF